MKIYRRDAEQQSNLGRVFSGLLRVSVPLWFLFLALGCSRPRPEDVFHFPEQASGWAKQGATRGFTAENLYEYIDGDAEKYVQAGVKVTQSADYKYQDKFEAVADVFMMGDAEGARKVFESQPAVGSKPAPLGDAGRVYSGSVTFHQGPFFVRLVAYDAQASDALVELGRAIGENLRRVKRVAVLTAKPPS